MDQENLLPTPMRTALVATLVSLLAVIPATLANATNTGTVTGVATKGCALTWHAASVNNTALTNTDATYPRLMEDLAGNSVDYSNGGFIRSVSPDRGGAGLFEIQHWYDHSKMYFRIPLATDYPTTGGTMTVTLPAGYTYSQVGLTPYDYVAAVYGTKTPPKYMSATVTPTVTLDGNIATVTYPAMPSDSHALSVQFMADIGSESNAVSRIATATYKATYVQGGSPTCPITTPKPPKPKPINRCDAWLTGQTVFGLLNTDVTVRDKWDNFGTIRLSSWTADRSKPTPMGEINADGWGMPSPTFRLYAATNVAQTSVTLTWRAAQGYTFKPGSLGAVITANPTGMGELYAKGYTVAATGIGTPRLSADGRTVTLTVARMPASSAVALTAIAIPDGSGKALVINSISRGTIDAPYCTCSPRPTPTITTTVVAVPRTATSPGSQEAKPSSVAAVAPVSTPSASSTPSESPTP